MGFGVIREVGECLAGIVDAGNSRFSAGVSETSSLLIFRIFSGLPEMGLKTGFATHSKIYSVIISLRRLL